MGFGLHLESWIDEAVSLHSGRGNVCQPEASKDDRGDFPPSWWSSKLSSDVGVVPPPHHESNGGLLHLHDAWLSKEHTEFLAFLILFTVSDADVNGFDCLLVFEFNLSDTVLEVLASSLGGSLGSVVRKSDYSTSTHETDDTQCHETNGLHNLISL